MVLLFDVDNTRGPYMQLRGLPSESHSMAMRFLVRSYAASDRMCLCSKAVLL